MSNISKPIVYTPTEQDGQDFAGLLEPVSGHICKDNGTNADLIIWPHVVNPAPLKVSGVEQGEGAGKYKLVV